MAHQIWFWAKSWFVRPVSFAERVRICGAIESTSRQTVTTAAAGASGPGRPCRVAAPERAIAVCGTGRSENPAVSRHLQSAARARCTTLVVVKQEDRISRCPAEPTGPRPCV
jgi:hypothetical protein